MKTPLLKLINQESPGEIGYYRTGSAEISIVKAHNSPTVRAHETGHFIHYCLFPEDFKHESFHWKKFREAVAYTYQRKVTHCDLDHSGLHHSKPHFYGMMAAKKFYGKTRLMNKVTFINFLRKKVLTTHHD
jgi:hypothetical protein